MPKSRAIKGSMRYETHKARWENGRGAFETADTIKIHKIQPNRGSGSNPPPETLEPNAMHICRFLLTPQSFVEMLVGDGRVLSVPRVNRRARTAPG